MSRLHDLGLWLWWLRVAGRAGLLIVGIGLSDTRQGCHRVPSHYLGTATYVHNICNVHARGEAGAATCSFQASYAHRSVHDCDDDRV